MQTSLTVDRIRLLPALSFCLAALCASVIFYICIDALTGRGFLKVASRQPKCAVQEKVLLAYRVLRRPIHIILKQLESRTSIPVSHCSVQENGSYVCVFVCVCLKAWHIHINDAAYPSVLSCIFVCCTLLYLTVLQMCLCECVLVSLGKELQCFQTWKYVFI